MARARGSCGNFDLRYSEFHRVAPASHPGAHKISNLDAPFFLNTPWPFFVECSLTKTSSKLVGTFTCPRVIYRTVITVEPSFQNSVYGRFPVEQRREAYPGRGVIACESSRSSSCDTLAPSRNGEVRV